MRRGGQLPLCFGAMLFSQNHIFLILLEAVRLLNLVSRICSNLFVSLDVQGV